MDKRVNIYGFIGEDFWNPENSNTAATLLAKAGDLKSGDTLSVHINSGGGDFFEGLSIYNNLRGMASRGIAVTCVVDGLAASAASLILLGGDTRVVPAASLVMIHNVWSWAVGDANAMAKAAEDLRKFNDSAATVYSERSGLSEADALALMDAETWMNGEEALAQGFATEAPEAAESDDPAAKASACVLPQGLKNVPQSLRKTRTDGRAITPDMALGKRPAAAPSGAPPRVQSATPAAQPKETTMDLATQENSGAPTADVQAAVKAEKGRAKAVRELIAKALANNTIDQKQADALIAEHVDGDKSTGIEGVKAALADAILVAAEKKPETQPVNTVVRVTGDGQDRFRAGVEKAILAHAGLEKRDDRSEFRGINTLAKLGAQCLHEAGVRLSGADALDKEVIAKRVMAAHTTTDFPLIMQNVANKLVMKGFEEEDEIYEQICDDMSVTDYKQVALVDANMWPSLDKVEEGAEYTYATFGERGAVISVAKYGNMLIATEEAFINDDTNLLLKAPRKMGNAARRTIGNLVFAQITSNPNFNGAAVFTSGRKNLLTGAGSALNDAGVTAADTLFTTRTELDAIGQGQADAVASLTPSIMLTPRALKHQAMRLMNDAYVPAANNQGVGTTNTHRDAYKLLSSPRLDRVAGGSTRWFLLAEPSRGGGLMLAYLNGQKTPQVQEAEAFTRDVMQWKVRLPGVGCAWEGYHAWQRNDGA